MSRAATATAMRRFWSQPLVRKMPEGVRPRALLLHEDLHGVTAGRFLPAAAIGNRVAVASGHYRNRAMHRNGGAVELEPDELTAVRCEFAGSCNCGLSIGPAFYVVAGGESTGQDAIERRTISGKP